MAERRNALIGSLDALVMLTILRLGENAHGESVVRALLVCTGLPITASAVSKAEVRLTNRGLLVRTSASNGVYANRNVYSLTPAGVKALEAFTSAFDAMRLEAPK